MYSAGGPPLDSRPPARAELPYILQACPATDIDILATGLSLQSCPGRLEIAATDGAHWSSRRSSLTQKYSSLGLNDEDGSGCSQSLTTHSEDHQNCLGDVYISFYKS